MTIIVLRLLVCGFAAFRLARALSRDTISEPFRLWLHESAYGPDGGTDGRGGVFWRWAYALCSCPYCASWWFGLGLYGAWLWWPWARPLIAAIAVAGLAAQLVGIDVATDRSDPEPNEDWRANQ